jgi:hypothetical protein
MAISVLQSNSGNTGAVGSTSVPVTLSSPSTAGNVLVMTISADSYYPSPPVGWTQNANSVNMTFLGQYVYTKTAVGGEASWNVTSGSPASVSWVVLEVAGVALPVFDGAVAQFIESSGATYTTGNLTPTTGERLLVAAFGGSLNTTGIHGVGGWTNSFTAVNQSWTTRPSGDNNNASIGVRRVVADGSTAYNTAVLWDDTATPQARASILLSLKGTGINTEPTANAGPDQTVTVGSIVTLQGSGTDVDGTIVGYTWRQISGTSVTLSSTSVATPSFTAPATSGVLVFGLKVTDDNAAESLEDTVTITVTQVELLTAAKIRIGGVWVDKPLFVRSGGIWKS